eukprot:8065928-Alexandrium_andersonii.AAC.1
MHNDKRPTRFWATESRLKLRNAAFAPLDAFGRFWSLLGAPTSALNGRVAPNSANNCGMQLLAR